MFQNKKIANSCNMWPRAQHFFDSLFILFIHAFSLDVMTSIFISHILFILIDVIRVNNEIVQINYASEKL